MTADVRLIVKPKNARICRAMEAKGYNTVAELCHALGLKVGGRSYYALLNLANFSRKPIQRNGAWRATALEVASLLDVEPEQLWPEYLRDIELKRPAMASIDVTVEQLAAMHGSEQQLIDRDLVSKLLARLPPREKLVLELHYGLNGKGEHTFLEIAPLIGLTTPEGARRVEVNALRRCAFWTEHDKLLRIEKDDEASP